MSSFSEKVYIIASAIMLLMLFLVGMFANVAIAFIAVFLFHLAIGDSTEDTQRIVLETAIVTLVMIGMWIWVIFSRPG